MNSVRWSSVSFETLILWYLIDIFYYVFILCVWIEEEQANNNGKSESEDSGYSYLFMRESLPVDTQIWS